VLDRIGIVVVDLGVVVVVVTVVVTVIAGWCTANPSRAVVMSVVVAHVVVPLG
jgi:hypothetical protein